MEPQPKSSARGQTRLVVTVFACVLAVLGLSYYFFLRSEDVVLYSELRPADASAIVTELDRRGIAYRLRDGGTTILVADGESDAVRLAVAGSDLPLNGLVGFELFNESDLGLTDFTQKINYQRAMQGELARTIMMMDGVENARVHLAIPERTLFRANRSETRAAVTVVPRRGRGLDEARVAGIQRLVASSVPDLPLANVVVLDEVGRVISSSAAPDAAMPPALEEQAAAESYYRARIRSAIERQLASHRFDVRVAILSPAAAPVLDAASLPAPPGAGRRQFRLRVTILTAEPLGAEERSLVLAAASGAAELDEQAGDSVVFGIGPVGLSAATPPPAVSPAPRLAAPGERAAERPGTSSASGWWPAVAAAFALAALLLLLRARAVAPSPDSRAFVERLRLQLAAEEARGG
ncbi:MAG TPA: flagellar basal-body MS-ring/collar protein FliF [Allosphingosinicella sp.]